MLYEFGKWLLWTGLAVYVIAAFIVLASASSGKFLEDYIRLVFMFTLILCGLGVASLLVMILFFGNRYRMGFMVGPKGVAWTTVTRRAKWSNRVALAAGLLGGRPGLAGAGLLAQANEQGLIEWDDIRTLRVYEEHSTISLKNSWRVVIRLHCTPENFKAVLDAVRRGAPHAVVRVTVLLFLLWAGPGGFDSSIAGASGGCL